MPVLNQHYLIPCCYCNQTGQVLTNGMKLLCRVFCVINGLDDSRNSGEAKASDDQRQKGLENHHLATAARGQLEANVNHISDLFGLSYACYTRRLTETFDSDFQCVILFKQIFIFALLEVF